MAKITRVGGLTDITVREVLPTVVTQPVIELEIDGVKTDVTADVEGSWPGSSSETSPAKPPKSDGPATPSRPKRVPGMGSRSRQGQAGSSSASSTGTSGPETGG